MIRSTGEIARRSHAREEMKDPETRHIMLKIAEGHERQAQILEKKKSCGLSKPKLSALRTDTYNSVPEGISWRREVTVVRAGATVSGMAPFLRGCPIRTFPPPRQWPGQIGVDEHLHNLSDT